MILTKRVFFSRFFSLMNVHHFKEGVGGLVEGGDGSGVLWFGECSSFLKKGTWETRKRRLGCRKRMESVDMEW